MFAIIRTGGKQYKVSKDSKIIVEKLDSEVGTQILLTDVLMVGTDTTTVVGTPVLKDTHVVANVSKQTRDAKIIVFKKKRRHNYRRKKGHKQDKTILTIVDIVHGGVSTSATPVEKPSVVTPKVKKSAGKKED